MANQVMVHLGLAPEDLARLDDWAKARGVARNRAVVALLDLATGVTETKEQKLARAKGLLAGGPSLPDLVGAPEAPVEPIEGRVVDTDPEFQQ